MTKAGWTKKERRDWHAAYMRLWRCKKNKLKVGEIVKLRSRRWRVTDTQGQTVVLRAYDDDINEDGSVTIRVLLPPKPTALRI